MTSGKDFLKNHVVLSWRWKVYSDWEDVTSSGRAFQVFGPATGKARLPTVDRLTDGTRRRLVPVERSDRLPERLRTGTSGPRYGGALPWRTNLVVVVVDDDDDTGDSRLWHNVKQIESKTAWTSLNVSEMIQDWFRLSAENKCRSKINKSVEYYSAIFYNEEKEDRTASVVALVVGHVTETESRIAAGGGISTSISWLTTMIERNQSNYNVMHSTRRLKDIVLLRAVGCYLPYIGPATRHKWARPALTPARQAGTQFTRSQRDGRLSWPGWLVSCYIPQTVSHPSKY